MEENRNINLGRENPRIMRGYAILAKGDEPKEIKKNVYKIPSQSGNKDYIAKYENGKWSCTCPDYKHRKVICKHIHAVILWRKNKRKVKTRKNRGNKTDYMQILWKF